MNFSFLRPESRPSAPAPSRQAPASWREILRWAGITASGLAVFLGLYLQSGIAFIPAFIIGLTMALLIAASHAMFESAENAAQIGLHVQDLKASLDRLSEELQRVELAAMNFNGVERLDQHIRELGRLNQDLRFIAVTSDQLREVALLSGQLDQLRNLLRPHQPAPVTTPEAKAATASPATGPAAPHGEEAFKHDKDEKQATDRSKSVSDNVVVAFAHPSESGKEKTASRYPQTATDGKSTASPSSKPNADKEKRSEKTAKPASNVAELAEFRRLVDRIRQHTEGRTFNGSEAEQQAFLLEVRRAVEANRIDYLVQPILRLPTRQPAYYQAQIELRDEKGLVLQTPPEVLKTHLAEIIPTLDDQILYRSEQMVQRLRHGHTVGGIICPVHETAFTDDDFFAALNALLDQQSEATGRLILEISQAGLNADRDLISGRLGELFERGNQFCLSQVQDLDIDFGWLRGIGFRFVKFDAADMLKRFTAPDSALDNAEFTLMLREAEITPILSDLDDPGLFDDIVRRASPQADLLALGRAVAKPIPVQLDNFPAAPEPPETAEPKMAQRPPANPRPPVLVTGSDATNNGEIRGKSSSAVTGQEDDDGDGGSPDGSQAA